MVIRRRRDGTAALDHTGRAPSGAMRSLTAAVAVLQNRRIRSVAPARKGAVSRPWQTEAWGLFDEIGELRFAAMWLANAVSRCALYAGITVPGSDEPEMETDGPGPDLVEQWAGGPSGQAQLLRRAAAHLAVAGDTYITGRAIDGGEDWRACSTEEITHANSRWQINDGSGTVKLSDQDVVFRCWLPHPRTWQEADSPVLASLPVLRELRGLTMHVSAQIDSRLAGAGLLVLPEEVTFPQPKAGPSDDVGGEDNFVSVLTDYMITPIRDRDHASAVVPLPIQVKGDWIDKIKLIHFWTDLDATARELRDEAIRRWSIGADMPPEVLLGMSEANHWGAWRISDEAVTLHIAPLASILADAITVGWYRPALIEAGMSEEEAERRQIGVDTTRLTQRPDRSESAVTLYDRAEITPEALRRENGFDESDAPSGEDQARLLILRLIREAPALADRLVPLLGIPLPTTPAEDTPAPAGDTPEPPPETDDIPGTQDDNGEDAVVAAVNVGVLRALEVAGKRLLSGSRSYRGAYPNVPAHELHTRIPVADHDLDRLLAGAWSCLEQALPSRPGAVAVADEYVRQLLLAGERHDRRYLMTALRRAGACCGAT